jgi:hypothetical protein
MDAFEHREDVILTISVSIQNGHLLLVAFTPWLFEKS